MDSVAKLRHMGRQYSAGQYARSGGQKKHFLEEVADEIELLRGEQKVLADLLLHAVAVLRTIDPKETSEAEILEGLIARAEKACDDVIKKALHG